MKRTIYKLSNEEFAKILRAFRSSGEYFDFSLEYLGNLFISKVFDNYHLFNMTKDDSQFVAVYHYQRQEMTFITGNVESFKQFFPNVEIK